MLFSGRTKELTQIAPLLAVVALGCGEVSNDDSGAASGGGSGGVGVPDKWLVHVEVVNKPVDSGPISVLASDPTGAMDVLTQTDASGTVDVQIGHLGAVTVFQSTEFGSGVIYRSAQTLFDVDQALTFRVRYLESNDYEPHGQVRFVPDTTTFPSGTVAWSIYPACAGQKQTMYEASEWILYEQLDACEGASETFAVAFALDAAGKALAATLLEHLPLTADDQTVSVSFANPKAFTNFEPAVPSGDIDPALVSGTLWAQAPGTSYGQGAHLYETFGYNEELPSPLFEPVLTDFFSAFQIQLVARRPDVPGVLVGREVTRFLSTSTFPNELAVDPLALAPVESVSAVDWTVPDRPRRSYSIAPGPLGNCSASYMSWTLSNGLAQWMGTRDAEASGAFQMPEIPSSLSDYVPSPESDLASWGTSVGHTSRPTPCSDLATWTDARTESANAP